MIHNLMIVGTDLTSPLRVASLTQRLGRLGSCETSTHELTLHTQLDLNLSTILFI